MTSDRELRFSLLDTPHYHCINPCMRRVFCIERVTKQINLKKFELNQKPLSKYLQTMIAYSPPNLRIKVKLS
jgi:hypothetical protein